MNLISHYRQIANLPGAPVFDVTAPRYGAKGDGVADDTSAVLAALSAVNTAGAGTVYFPPGVYRITAALALSAAGAKILADDATLSVAEGWTNTPLLTISGARCTVTGLTAAETNASATNIAKNNGQNVGILISASYVTIDRCNVDGFGFPIALRGSAADHTRCTIRDTVASRGYAWGLEIDSCTAAALINVTTHSNGLDGIKLENEYSRTCDGLVVQGGESYNNGLRDAAAGGAEATNGNGIDLFNGGFRFSVTDLYCHENYGSGFNFKGDATAHPIMGQGSLSGCHSHNNKSTSTGTSHGFEFNTGGDTGASVITLTNCHAGGNTGRGISILGGHGHSIIGGSVVGNGAAGITLRGFDAVVSGVQILNNTGIGINVGSSDAGTWVPKRVRIRDCVISGRYDTNLAANADPRAGTGAKVTTTAIRVYSDSADVTISGVEVSNCESAVLSRGQRVHVDNLTAYGCGTGTVQAHAGDLTLRTTTIQEVDFAVGALTGALYCGAATIDADRIAFIQASATTSAQRAVRINNASGVLTLGEFSTSNYTDPTVLISSGALRRGTLRGTGSPEGVVTAPVGSLYLRIDGGAVTTAYIKESGTGNIGWQPK